VRKDAAKLLIRNYWCAAGRHRGDWRKKQWEVMARKRVEQPQEEGEEVEKEEEEEQEEEEEEEDDDDDDDDDDEDDND